MRILISKEDSLQHVLESMGNMVAGKYFFLPGWWEKLENGEMQFHHSSNLPKELLDIIQPKQETNDDTPSSNDGGGIPSSGV